MLFPNGTTRVPVFDSAAIALCDSCDAGELVELLCAAISLDDPEVVELCEDALALKELRLARAS